MNPPTLSPSPLARPSFDLSERSRALAASEVRLWNEQFPPGTLITYRPAMPGEAILESHTRTVAFLCHGHTAVVVIEGHLGGVLLSRVTVRKESEAAQ
jgi:hypothetical protein